MLLSEKIRIARRGAELSQEALGAVMGKSQGAVSQWEQGVTTPEFDAVLPLSRALGVTLDWLLGADDTPYVQMHAAMVPKNGMQVINQLSEALANQRISALQLHLLAGLINEFSSIASRPADSEDV